MLSETILLDLVGSVYDAATDPGLWPVFLDKFAEAVQSASTQIFLYDVERHGGNLAATTRLDPQLQKEYNEYYIGVDCFGIHGLKLITTGNVATGQMMCPDSILEDSEFYNDFLRRMGTFHQLGGFIYKDRSVASVISTLRPKGAGPFDEGDVQLLRALMPHLQRAVQLHQRIASLENKADSVSEALDRIPIGFLVMDAASKVVVLNHRAQTILNLNDGLSLGRNGLVTPRLEETNHLRGLIQSAIAGSSGKGIGSGGIMTVSRPSLRRSFQVLVTPLRSRASTVWPEKAAAAIFLSDPESQTEPSDKILGRLFGLTPAEARLAAALMKGNSLEQAAGEFHLSRNTVRSQLRKIFDKTDTKRQGELIRLLLSSPVQFELD